MLFDRINMVICMRSYIFENKGYKTLNIRTLGYQACPSLHSFGYADTDFYLIHHVLSGSGTFVKNGDAHTVSAGEAFIIKPGNTYTYTADEFNPWEYVWFSFNGEIASMFENIGDIIPSNRDIVLDMLEVSELKNTQTEFLTGKLYEFISSVFESAPAESNHVKKASDYIKANCTHKLYVSDIANAMNLSSRYLSRIFKEEKGLSMQEYILKYKLKKAKTLLSQGFNVSETAQMVGYEDQFIFSKIFKKHIGISPSKYAKN